MTSLDIILPCYKPTKDWELGVFSSYEAIKAALSGIKLNLIIINDGSVGDLQTARSWLLERIPGLTWIEYGENRGKGFALRQGMRRSQASYSIFTDIDFPYETSSLVEVFNALTEGHAAPDVVVGKRSTVYYRQVPFLRNILSRAFRLFLKCVYGLNIADTQCGLKGFNSIGRSLFLKTSTDRYLIDLEFLLFASRNRNVVIKTVNAQLREGVIFSKLGIVAILTEIRSLTQILFKFAKWRFLSNAEEQV